MSDKIDDSAFQPTDLVGMKGAIKGLYNAIKGIKGIVVHNIDEAGTAAVKDRRIINCRV